MAFLPGYGAKVFANEVAVSSTIRSWNATHSRGLGEVTTIQQTGVKFVPGLKSGSISLAGPQDSTGQSLHAEILSSVGVDNGLTVTLLPDGDAVGKPALFAVTDPTDWAIDASATEAVGFTMNATADESVEMGYVLHALGAETADGNGTAVDRAVSSTLGAAAVLHVTAFTGLTNAIIKVQHSPDNSVWSDLVTFTTVTAIGSQRVTVAAGTTINRYLRVNTDVTGTGSVTYLAAVAPR